jgi:hypothetical protein
MIDDDGDRVQVQGKGGRGAERSRERCRHYSCKERNQALYAPSTSKSIYERGEGTG